MTENMYRFGSADAVPRALTRIEDVLSQLDRVDDEPCSEVLDRLRRWMDEPEPPTTSVASIFVAGGARAQAREFIGSLNEDDRAVVTSQQMAYCPYRIDDGLVIFQYAPLGTIPDDEWDRCIQQSIGAVVLVDLSYAEDSHPSLTYLEQHGVPYVVAVSWDPRYTVREIREAFDLPEEVPLTFWKPFGRRPELGVAKAYMLLTKLALAQKADAKTASADGAQEADELLDTGDLNEQLAACMVQLQLEYQ
ncbi:hypothetical protein [Streptomyces jumonjinensis]|uniref:hypothetical protein n=1 Tax=Streptomyces jumonjinensis TaxID=1945 RepID=UPI00378C9B60